MNALKRNWITSLAGVVIILGTVAQGFVFESADIIGFLSEKWELLVAAFGLLLAKDALKAKIEENPE
jgi:hypothetical protein